VSNEKYLKNIYNKKALIWAFAVTDLKLRYRNSVLGFLWSILEPLLMLTVLYLVFSYILRSDVENYPLFLLIGLISWNVFARGTVMGSNSVLSRGGIVLTVNIPKMILPLSAVITSFLMMLFELLVFAAFLIAFQFLPPTTIAAIPFSFIPLLILTLGFAFFLSVLNVMYRDIGYIWAVIIQAGFFLTPIIYQLDIFPETVQRILLVNPMAHIVIWMQDFTLYDKLPSLESIGYTFGFSIIIFVVGFFVFRRFENKMVDKL